MKSFLDGFESGLEKIDSYRNNLFYRFVTPYWPKSILPNHITWIRVFIGIAICILLFWFKIENKTLIISLFCIGLLTDLVDGPVARGTNNVTEFGAMLDSTADKLLIIPIALYGLFFSHKWVLLSLIVVEILNALTSLFYNSKEKYIESNIFAKTKMLLLSVVFAVILIVWPYSPPLFFIYLIWISMVFSVLSIFSRLMELNSNGHITNKTINKSLNKLDK